MRRWKKDKYLSHTARPVCSTPSCLGLLRLGFEVRSVRYGYYPRIWQRAQIQRFRCKCCLKTFSLSTHSLDYRQHKPFINSKLLLWFASAGSQRRGAIKYGVNHKTIASKFKTLGTQSRLFNERERDFISKYDSASFDQIQFDEMETSEHTKLKPLSIPLVVDQRTRKILGFDVCSMPAKGKLAAKSLERYGHRADERDDTLLRLLSKLKPILSETVEIYSDSKPQYEKIVKESLPKANHTQFISRRAASIGQGELKKGRNDPLFSLNHTAAMMRAHVNRLFRRTWNTTKKRENLKLHLEIYQRLHNTVLIHKKDNI